MSQQNLFECQTNTDAFKIKILAELLMNNLKTSHLKITQKGIFLTMNDALSKTLIDLHLDSNKFDKFKLNKPVDEDITIGVTLNHFHKILKSIKKKDSLGIRLDASGEHLYVKKNPAESHIQTYTCQSIDIEVPTGYGKPICVESSKFQNMCKDLGCIGNMNVTVKTYDSKIEFIANADDIITTVIPLGDETDTSEMKCMATFTTDQITRTLKIGALDKMLYINPPTNELPLKITTDVGNLGIITIYIKTTEIYDKEMSTDYS